MVGNQELGAVHETAADYQRREAGGEPIVLFPQQPPFRVDKNTLVPIGLVIAMVLGCTAGAWKISGALNEVQSKIIEASMKTDMRLEKIEENLADRWTTNDMVLWREEMINRNPDIKMPTVGEIRRSASPGGH